LLSRNLKKEKKVKTQLDQEWENFFRGGFYQTGWSWTIDAKRTQEEVDGAIALLNPPPGSHILDWCGGWGRHAIGFAKRGYKVTLLDFAESHIEMAAQAAKEAGVAVNLVCADFRETPESINADYVVNLFTAGLGYLTEEDDVLALTSLYRAIKPGARFLVDTMNLFWLARNYNPAGWHESADEKIRHLSTREFDFLSNRNQSKEILLVVGQPERRQNLNHRIYSPSELANVLRRAGFKPDKLYGDFNGSPFGFDSKKIIMISSK
jgi:ubiquinone/menaquinone biosynthesis C-methylase UbiE